MTTPPPLRDDCFALPRGVEWTPVDTALERLRAGLTPVVGIETLRASEAAGRILAAPLIAVRSNPAFANSAVDGYGFAHAALPESGAARLPLAEGRAAAGEPFAGPLPPGMAVRVLTGAALPEGVDTVVMQEDVEGADGAVVFRAGLRRGANCRPLGEDVAAGAAALPAGHRLRPQDLALAAAVGASELRVFRPLRVAVLSTGAELAVDGSAAAPHQIFDANRPMLRAMLARWGMEVVDLGQAPDTAEAVRARLDRGAAGADAILTTGGASAGDEDHISAVLGGAGALETWRIAIKPGRPLALGLWNGTPVFGLPGNPVAAFVTALVFGYPALCALSGAGWQTPRALSLPAAFAKSKKAGRREFLRARLGETGVVEVFRSEGSGLISGLSWADGLVELPDDAAEISPGDPVRYLPFSGFGL